MTIRPATISDADRVFALLTQLAVSYQPERGAFDTILSTIINSPSSCLLVAESSTGVLGYALANRYPALYANGHLWQLQELIVDSAYRSQGVGSRLLTAVIGHAQADNAAEVVVISRRAGEYYLKRGFVENARYYKLKLPAKQPRL